MSIGLILLIVLVLLLLGVLPTWGHSRSWGYGPSGGLGLLLMIVLVLDSPTAPGQLLKDTVKLNSNLSGRN